MTANGGGPNDDPRRRDVRVVFEHDGLLVRFGRVVPDALGAFADLRRLQARLARSLHMPALETGAIRFDVPDAARPTDAEGEELLHELVGPPRTADGAGSLSADEGDWGTRTILLTASAQRLREATSAGIDAYCVGTGLPPERRGLDFGDVTQMVADALRVPTARPMASGARTGGLVAVRTAGPADARARACAAMVEDLEADWVIIGRDLILYTEQPDLEDRLVASPNGVHLSYAVHRDSLFIEDTPGTEGEVLYNGERHVLVEISDKSCGETPTRTSWFAARRTTVGSPEPKSSGAAERGRQLTQLSQDPILSKGGDRWLDTAAEPNEVFAGVRDAVGVGTACDLHECRSGIAVTWSAPFTDAACEGIVVVSLAKIRSAIELATAIETVGHGSAVLYCAWVVGNGQTAEVLDDVLLAAEINMVTAVVETEDSRDESAMTAIARHLC